MAALPPLGPATTLATAVATSFMHIWLSPVALAAWRMAHFLPDISLTLWCGTEGTLVSWLCFGHARDFTCCGQQLMNGEGWELEGEDPPLLSERQTVLRSFYTVPQRPQQSQAADVHSCDQLKTHPHDGFPFLPLALSPARRPCSSVSLSHIYSV